MPDTTLEQFEHDARTFLEANAERRPAEQEFRWGAGSDAVAVLEEQSAEEEQRGLAAAKAWRAKKYDAGFGWITGPAEYGGRALPPAFDRAFASLEAQFKVPDQSFFGIGLGMVAPTILAHATPDVRQAYLPGMYRGDIVGCQMFSEPGAGSDLAGVQTRAERDGDEWRITGQKVWTSGAQYSDIGEIVCRTNPDAPKHKGITAFVIDMHAPGVEVRPLRQMTGGASFNEVFFDAVVVPDSHRLGDVNEGWTVALTTLMNERMSIGAGGAGLSGGSSIANGVRIIEMMRHFGVDKDPVLRQELARVYTGFQVAKYTNQRAIAKLRAGELPGPEMSISKLALTMNLRRLSEFAAHVLGPRVTADTGEWGTYAWGGLLLGVPGLRIAGGSDEVMRNVIGERVLGLPKEPDLSKDVKFRELKVGTQTST